MTEKRRIYNIRKRVVSLLMIVGIATGTGGCGPQDLIDKIVGRTVQETAQTEVYDKSNPDNLPIDEFAAANPDAKSWVRSQNVWYYFIDGELVKDGWVHYTDRYYYFSSDGSMVTHWLLDNGNWYYLDFQDGMATGWKKLMDDHWYFFDDQGIMQTGFVTDNEKEYYLDQTGKMLTNQEITIEGVTYSIDSDGVVTRGE